MKCNVIEKKINLDKLDDTISAYLLRNQSLPYLIMSSETAKDLTLQFYNPGGSITLSEMISTHYGTYKNYKIAICNNLEYGEIEVR